MARDRQVEHYVVGEGQNAEMKQIGIQGKIAEGGETAILHDERPIQRPGGSYELYVDGRKVGNFASAAEARSALDGG